MNQWNFSNQSTLRTVRMLATDLACWTCCSAFFSAALKVDWLACTVRRCFSSCFLRTPWCTEALACALSDRSTSTPTGRGLRFRGRGATSAPASPSSESSSLDSLDSACGSASISVTLFLSRAREPMMEATGLPARFSARIMASSSPQSMPAASAPLTAAIAPSTASRLRWISSARRSCASASASSATTRFVWSDFTLSRRASAARSCAACACSAFCWSIFE
mmetsp:Transcript_13316/g.33667  ORF Transcript_13316/g.33667 Transcript_13316/m.33667 type:complete len:222 (-) Transcript_13316:986-1651(-)